MSSHTHIPWVSEGWAKKMNIAQSDGVSLLQPPNNWRCDLVDSLTLSGRHLGIAGSPESWSHDLVLEVMIPHTTAYQYGVPAWMPVKAADLSAVVVGATIRPDGSIRLADQTSTLPAVFQIRLDLSGQVGFRTRSVITVASGTGAVTFSLNATERH